MSRLVRDSVYEHAVQGLIKHIPKSNTLISSHRYIATYIVL